MTSGKLGLLWLTLAAGALSAGPAAGQVCGDGALGGEETCDDGANWCPSPEPIHDGCGDLGSPGLSNLECPDCVDADGDGFFDADCDDTDPDVPLVSMRFAMTGSATIATA